MAGQILYWGDPPTISTGFGVVARHVLGGLRTAGYEIDCLATNSVADFPNAAEFPYRIVPAGGTAQDPFGARTFVRILASARRYDLVLVQNDLQVAHATSAYVRSLQERGQPMPPIVYYFPVDCAVRRDLGTMIEVADVAVTCTNFGRGEVHRTFPDRDCLVIPHGVDGRAFRPLAERAAVRDRFRHELGAPPDARIVCSVATNCLRKDLARTMAAFAAARARHPEWPPSVLYLHTVPMSNGVDLKAAADACGLTVGRDIAFPKDYHPLQGVPDAALNEIYNASDVYLTTTLGEGWGLPVTEAMAAGLPVVAPRHTAIADHGSDGRAILYDCRERVWIDNSGFRPLGRLEDIVVALAIAMSQPVEEARRMTEAARAYTAALDWSAVVPRWVALVSDLIARRGAVGRPS